MKFKPSHFICQVSDSLSLYLLLWLHHKINSSYFTFQTNYVIFKHRHHVFVFSSIEHWMAVLPCSCTQLWHLNNTKKCNHDICLYFFKCHFQAFFSWQKSKHSTLSPIKLNSIFCPAHMLLLLLFPQSITWYCVTLNHCHGRGLAYLWPYMWAYFSEPCTAFSHLSK